MKKVILLAAAAAMLTGTASAQRVMDKLDRGLVAVSANSGMFVSWRVFGEDADNVKFNLYRDGSLVNSQPLSVSNFTDAAGSPSSKYTVKTVVNGVEKESSAASLNSATDYLEIKIAPIPLISTAATSRPTMSPTMLPWPTSTATVSSKS